MSSPDSQPYALHLDGVMKKKKELVILHLAKYVNSVLLGEC